MPIYEYLCDDCHGQTEILVRGREQVTCPACGSQHLKKLLSVVATPSFKTGATMPACEAPPSGGFCGRGMCGMPECGS